jgi:hypothetical protein
VGTFAETTSGMRAESLGVSCPSSSCDGNGAPCGAHRRTRPSFLAEQPCGCLPPSSVGILGASDDVDLVRVSPLER